MDEKGFNYKMMFEEMVKKFKAQTDLQNEYFDLLSKIQNNKLYSDILCKHTFELNIAEQVMLYRISYELSKLQKQICINHGWDEESEEENI